MPAKVQKVMVAPINFVFRLLQQVKIAKKYIFTAIAFKTNEKKNRELRSPSGFKTTRLL